MYSTFIGRDIGLASDPYLQLLERVKLYYEWVRYVEE